MSVAHAVAEHGAQSRDLPIFVISLKRRTDRFLHMKSLLQSRGLNAQFIEAVDGHALSAAERACYDRNKALNVYGAEMNAAEIGCHLSHLKAYQTMLYQGCQTALVLEDDIECDTDFAELLDAIVSAPRKDWLVLRLQSTKGEIINGDRPTTRGDRTQMFRGRTLSRVRAGVLGGCAYLIRREGAERMLRYASRPFMPIDQTMDRYWENGIEPYVLRPFPVRQSPRISSEISTRKVKPPMSRRQTVLRRARRAADGVSKRAYALTRLGGWRRFTSPRPIMAALAVSPLWQAITAFAEQSNG